MMADFDKKVREKLERQAADWVEKEIAARMVHAREAIEEQADISSVMCGEEGARKHIREASAFAEENIRHELELEADEWVEEEIRKRSRPLLEDRPLESNLCGD